MWQGSGKKLRGGHSKNSRKHDRSHLLRLKRVEAEIRIAPKTLGAPPTLLSARVILNDLTPTGLGIFSPTEFANRQEVAITLEYPKRIFLKAKVIWCQNLGPQGRVVTEQPYRYRIGLEWIIESPEQKKEIEQYYKELIETLAPDPRKKAA